MSQQRVSAVLIAGFALGALLLTAMGLFGVVAGAVTRHELALRMALVRTMAGCSEWCSATGLGWPWLGS